MKNKILCLIIICFMCMFGFSACFDDTSDDKMARQTEKLMDEASREIGMPGITNFQQKKTLSKIYELCDDEKLICFAYMKNEMTGKLTFFGKCLGYGIPFSAQFSNPEVYKRVKPANTSSSKHWSYELIPQAEPNGLFMPESSSATWVLLINPVTNTGHVIYAEPLLTVSPFKLPPYIVDNYADVEKYEKELKEQKMKEKESQ